jgi:Predicted membrane protein (DUF2339)
MPNQLEETLSRLEARVAALEARLPPLVSAKPAPQAAAPSPVRQPSPRETPPPPASSFFGLIGVSFLILAAVFFLKLSVDSGWLNPERQVLLAALFGLACLLSPHFSPKLADSYGALLSGAGAAVLHLTWFAAFRIHHLLPREAALAAASAVGALCLLLNLRFASAAFVLVAVAGTYLAAPIIGYDTQEFGSLASFLLLWNLLFSLLGFFLKRREVILVAAFFAVLTVSHLSRGLTGDSLLLDCILLQILQFLIFTLATTAFSVAHRQHLNTEQAWASALLLLVLYDNLNHLLGILHPSLAPAVGLATAVAVLGMYTYASHAKPQQQELPSGPALTTFAALVLMQSLYLQMIPENGKPLFSLLLAVVLGFSFLRKRPSPAWNWPYLVGLLCILYGSLLTFDLRHPEGLALAYHFAYGLTAIGAIFLLGRREGREVEFILTFGHLQMLYGLYQLSTIYHLGGSLFVSLAWGLYALAILAWALARSDKTIGRSAVVILTAVALKAGFYDLLNTGSLARVLSLLASGALLYACGWLFRRMQGWEGGRATQKGA